MRSGRCHLHKAWPTLLAAMLLVVPAARAGECTRTDEYYLSVLEAGLAHPEFPYFECLGSASHIMTTLWAGNAHAARFAAARADTLTPRIAAAARRLLALPEAGKAEWRRSVLEVAAAHGIARLDTVDVFSELFASARPLFGWDYARMAILRDCRAVPILRRRYLELRADPAVEPAGEPVHVLSCLYHIPCDEAVALASELAATEKDPLLLERLGKVTGRGR